jgi:hypothetical protein
MMMMMMMVVMVIMVVMGTLHEDVFISMTVSR